MPQRALKVVPAAEADIDEAYAWYQQHPQAAGDSFLANVESALDSIFQNPRFYPIVFDEVRRALLAKFPYGVFFVYEKSDDEEHIVVIGCFHVRQNLGRWRLRQALLD